MSSKRQNARAVDEDRDVQYKVDNILDIVAHDLIESGQFPAAKSYMLKSPEMKAHVGRQVKSLNSRKYSTEGTGSNNITFKPLSIPIGIVAKFTAENGPKDKKSSISNKSATPSAKGVIKKAAVLGRSRTLTSKGPVKISHSKTVQLSTNHHQNEIKSSKKLIQPNTVSSNTLVQEAFNGKCDLKEFTNEEISLDIQEHTIVITGYRPRRGANNSRKVTEIVQVPNHVQMDRLRIGRRTDGTLIIEEVLQH